VANEQNLRPFTSDQSREEAVKNGSKGGIASGIARRKKKTMSEIATLMVSSKLDEKSKSKIQKMCSEVMDEDATVATMMVAGQIQAAAKGDSGAFKAVNALIKEQEEKDEKEEAERQAKLRKKYHLDLYDVPDTFHPVARAIRDEKYQEFVEKGGRGGTKSTFFAMIGIELLLNNHDIHWVVIRKVGNTLKDSVYSKIKWAINKQHLEDEFEYKTSPLEITLKSTGQKIYFRGADDPGKIKSIAPEFGYIGIVWFEELDQFTAEEVRNITQSVIRGGDKAWILKSFNPPQTMINWVNKYVLEPKKNRLVHHSTYKDVPKEWLGQPFIEEAEHLKETNPAAYEHEYEGTPNGNGGNVFEYLEIRTITDKEIESFDRIYQGVDWGWYPDIFAFKRLYVDVARKKIYHIAEITGNKLKNETTAKMIIDAGFDDYAIICDSAEPKSVNDYRDAGLPARGAVKGPGSVEYGMKFLQGFTHVIDPVRTPVTYKEFTEYEYERDKDGNVISGYPDANNHTIDSTRYALEPLFNKRGNSA
jgi:PBSX family phage terminase large subunit